MSPAESKLIENYLEALNSYNEDLYVSCFRNDATTFDAGENEKVQGTPALGTWFDKNNAKYRSTNELIKAQSSPGKLTLIIRTDGNFSGSPITFLHELELNKVLIQNLKISVAD